MGSRVFLVRHGETEWSRAHRHTGRTDLPLTEEGRRVAQQLGPRLARERFTLVLSSPRQRALETARLAGLGPEVVIDPDLSEWDYGEYEGLTTPEIRERVPDWTVFTHPCPGGETQAQVSARADRVVERLRTADGDVAVFSHGHMGRVLTARWLGLEARFGRHFVLGTATLNLLGYERETPAVVTWNVEVGGAA